MMSDMTAPDIFSEAPANILCKDCGLCCTGHLFIWTKLRSVELDSIEALGVNVVRSIPSQRGFNQPCPLWQGQCTIYEAPHYPRFCRTYKCTLLKQLLDERISLTQALSVIRQAKELIREVETILPPSSNPNFRERLAAHLEDQTDSDPEFRHKAAELLSMYEQIFGVKDVIE
jgi:hypothetical protein